ncbi:MAG: hypothetical protein COW67_07415 [Flavobacteriales bacterium CG18_big_fil_WC_8_21_14_2_50_32_9]|nr:MAG: hypothetical protein COW67_07415 [Flavobacteriales bacterium CG18_big_fil_WC_8_21_14_2_50_32_9]
METTTQNDPGKTVAIISYITIIGFIIAIVMHNDNKNKSELGAFHIRQALGIFITGFSLMIVSLIFTNISGLNWIVAILAQISYIGLFVFWILGLIAAVNAEKKALPLIGDFYQNLLKGIK